MFLGSASAESSATEQLIERRSPWRWGVDSETGRLSDVLLSAPAHLAMVPCNAVTRDSLERGLSTCAASAGVQHRALVSRFEAAGVECHFVPPKAGLPDLAFTRDSVLMTPWGAVELRPAELHRRGEAAHLTGALRRLGIDSLGAVEEGRVEGGDVCILRPGLVMIGISGERTDEAGARALDRLEANLLSLGGRRIVAPAGEARINRALQQLGYEVIEVEIDQFVRCGGGVHCLTMPLARAAPLP